MAQLNGDIFNPIGVGPGEFEFLIDGITMDRYSRFWHNDFMGWLNISFTNQSPIPGWTPFIAMPRNVNVESMSHLANTGATIYAISKSNKISSISGIPSGTHAFNMCVSLL